MTQRDSFVALTQSHDHGRCRAVGDLAHVHLPVGAAVDPGLVVVMKNADKEKSYNESWENVLEAHFVTS